MGIGSLNPLKSGSPLNPGTLLTNMSTLLTNGANSAINTLGTAGQQVITGINDGVNNASHVTSGAIHDIGNFGGNALGQVGNDLKPISDPLGHDAENFVGGFFNFLNSNSDTLDRITVAALMYGVGSVAGAAAGAGATEGAAASDTADLGDGGVLAGDSGAALPPPQPLGTPQAQAWDSQPATANPADNVAYSNAKGVDMQTVDGTSGKTIDMTNAATDAGTAGTAVKDGGNSLADGSKTKSTPLSSTTDTAKDIWNNTPDWVKYQGAGMVASALLAPKQPDMPTPPTPPQSGKSPDIQNVYDGMFGRGGAGGQAGIADTLLTGSTGVDPNTAKNRKTSLIGN